MARDLSKQRVQDDPAVDAAAITPNDSGDHGQFRGLYVGTGGNITLITVGGSTVLFSNVPTGVILPVSGNTVKSSGTTASNIVALY